MKYGFISDIHGNYEGLRLALFHLSQLKCEIICLGDIVSENSEQNESCIQLLKTMNVPIVKGQHDDTCAKCNSPAVSRDAQAYLAGLPDMIQCGDILCVHDNPLEKARAGKGMWQNGSYVRSHAEAAVVFEDFFRPDCGFQWLFIGHTHTPKIFSKDAEIPFEFNQPIRLPGGRSYSQACETVFLKIPHAYPHPKTLVSLSRFCGTKLDLDQLSAIYDMIVMPPPFPWDESELVEALERELF